MKHKIHKWLCQEQEKNSKQRNKNNSGLYPGYKTTTGFTLMREITTLDQFWRAINTEKSIFARHRMYPTAFFFSWQIKTIKEWKRKATIIMRKYKHKCVLCGSWATEVHHLTYERVYLEDVRDLIAVCSECHKFIHSIETESYIPF